jgi:hypothetical protein
MGLYLERVRTDLDQAINSYPTEDAPLNDRQFALDNLICRATDLHKEEWPLVADKLAARGILDRAEALRRIEAMPSRHNNWGAPAPQTPASKQRGADAAPSQRPPLCHGVGMMIEGFNLVSLGGLEEPPPREQWLDGRLVKGHPTLLFADGGQGKSMLALAIATAVASGKDFLGLKLPAGPALYLDFELSLEEQTRRAFKVARGLGLEKPPLDLFHHEAQQPLPRLADELRKAAQERGPVLIVIDSLGPGCGADPESAREMIALFSAIRSLGCSTLLIDHMPKPQEGHQSKTPFGSAYKFNLSRSVLYLERVASKPGELSLGLVHKKSNFGLMQPDLALRGHFTAASVRFEAVDPHLDPTFAERAKAEDRVLACLQANGRATADQLARRLPALEVNTVKNQLTQLKKQGKVKEDGKAGRQTIWAAAVNIIPDPLHRGGTFGTDVSGPSADQIKAVVEGWPQERQSRFFDLVDQGDIPGIGSAELYRQVYAQMVMQ